MENLDEAPPKVEDSVPLIVEFTYDYRGYPIPPDMILITRSGGLEMLFSNQRKHAMSLPSTDENGKTSNLAFLVRYLCEHVMKDRRKELFVIADTVFVVRSDSRIHRLI